MTDDPLQNLNVFVRFLLPPLGNVMENRSSWERVEVVKDVTVAFSVIQVSLTKADSILRSHTCN